MHADRDNLSAGGGGQRWPLLALVVVVVAHLLVMARWLALDQSFGATICCDLTAPVSRLVVASGTTGLPWRTLWQAPHVDGLMSWAAVGPARAWGYDGDTLVGVQLGLGVALQVLAFLLVRRLAGPWPGVLAAAALPMVPGVAFGLRTWSPYPGQWAALVGFTWALVASRSLSRPQWMIPAAAFVWMGAGWSSAITDDMLFLGSAGVIALAALSRGLLGGRDAMGGTVLRWRVALGALLLVLVGLAPTLWSWGQRADMQYLVQYTLREMGVEIEGFQPWGGHEQAVLKQLADPRSAAARLAYARRLLDDELGLGLVAFLAPLGLLHLVRGRGRAELWAALLGPLVALSALGKKQIFYDYMVIPFAVLIVAAGLGPGRPQGRWGLALRLLLGLGLVGVLGQRWAVESFDTGWKEPGQRWEEPLFQFPIGVRMAPLPADVDPLATWMAQALPSACPTLASVGCLGDEYEPTDLGREVAGQCIVVEHANPQPPPGSHEPQRDAMLVKLGEDERCEADPHYRWMQRYGELAQDPGWRLLTREVVRRRCWALLVRRGGPLDPGP